MSFILTDQQRDLITDNHKLIYAFLQSHKLNLDEYYGVAALGLCKAAHSYKPDRGATFATYAYRVMLHEYYMTLRRKQIPTVSLSTIINADTDGDEITLGDTLQSDADTEVAALISMLLDHLCVNNRDRLIIWRRIAGHTRRDIGSTLGVTGQAVSKRLRQIRFIINNYI